MGPSTAMPCPCSAPSRSWPSPATAPSSTCSRGRAGSSPCSPPGCRCCAEPDGSSARPPRRARRASRRRQPHAGRRSGPSPRPDRDKFERSSHEDRPRARWRDGGCPGCSRLRVRTCTHQPARRAGEDGAAVLARRADREGGRDDDEGRPHPPAGVLGRLVRRRARLEAPGAVDRLGRGRRHPEGHVDGWQRADRRDLALRLSRQRRLRQDLHVRRRADVLRRLDRELERPRVVRRARPDARGHELARRRRRQLDASDHRARRRRRRRPARRCRARREGRPTTGMTHRWGLLLYAGVVIALAVPASASAHAYLVRTVPSASGVVNTPPAQVSLTFDEAVEPRFAIISVTDKDGHQVTDGRPARSPTDPNTLVVPLKKIPEGWYLVYWRVISVDGHPVRGAFTFAVGPNQGPQPEFVIPSIAESAATPRLVAARAAVFLTVMSAIGLFVLRLGIARPLIRRVDGTNLRAVSIAFFAAAALGLIAIPVYLDVATAEFSLRSAFDLGAVVPLVHASAFGRRYIDLWIRFALFVAARAVP